MKTFVTGGAGFIGSHLCERLLAHGGEVVVLDDLSTGRLENIEHLRTHPRFRFVRGSLLDEEAVQALARDADCVYHLGAAVGVRLVFEQPARTIETNVKGTQIVLDAALRDGCKVFLASTSEVYGKDVREPRGRFNETDDITYGVSMRWCYASSKALDEYLARAYHSEKGLPIVIGRFFNTVGPRQSGAYGMVVPRFVEQALAGRPITVYGDGTQVRTFTWVGDAVGAVMALMDAPGAVGEIFNIGSEESVTVRELAERVKSLTESPSPITYISYDEAYGAAFEDIRYRVPDISKLKAAVGYRPSMDLNGILHAVIAFMRGERTGREAEWR